MDDLIGRLRSQHALIEGGGSYAWKARNLCGKAADRIEALEAEIASLRARKESQG